MFCIRSSMALPFILTLLSRSTVGLNNGVALTPPMGWNPYNVYSCNTDEDQYRAAAQALVDSGLRDVGYKYFNLDCGWQGKSRADGVITWDTTRIPSGIPTLAEYVHGLGLLFGLYADAGFFACDSSNGAEYRIGSLGHESIDAETFAQWIVDYLKYDNCYTVSPTDFVDFNPYIQEQDSYQRMGDALATYRSNMVYSICEWGVQNPARWAGAIGNSWRISNDISPDFQSLRRIINQLVPIPSYAKPGAWNDLDLLEVGNDGLTSAEWGMQFAFWAAAKSPLIISTDITTASEEVLSILKNEAIIRINQDPLGSSIYLQRRYTDNYDVWAGPLADGSKVVVLLNWLNAPQTITFNLADVSLFSADLTDLWTGTDLGTVDEWTTADVDAHGALIYKLTNCVDGTPRSFSQQYLAASSANQLAGGAYIRALDGYTNVVSNIGYYGVLTFVGVDGGSDGGTKLVSIGYVNADYTFFDTGCPNCRRAVVQVNSAQNVVVEFPLSGQSWDNLAEGYLVSLDGFNPGQDNTITFSNAATWAPDIYNLLVEV